MKLPWPWILHRQSVLAKLFNQRKHISSAGHDAICLQVPAAERRAALNALASLGEPLVIAKKADQIQASRPLWSCGCQSPQCGLSGWLRLAGREREDPGNFTVSPAPVPTEVVTLKLFSALVGFPSDHLQLQLQLQSA
jgi:hypothetical protein